jgi:hypothetical protein
MILTVENRITAVAQLVEALHYKLESRAFDYRWSDLNFSVTILSAVL